MAIRYLLRRKNAEDLGELKAVLGNELETKLGKADNNLRRSFRIHFSPTRTALYTFTVRKKEKEWTWVCPSIELAAESEAGLRKIAEKYQVKDLPHMD